METFPSLILGPIIGALSHDSVRLWGRADRECTLTAWIGRQPDLSDARLAGQSVPLVREDGCAGIVQINDLEPDTQYFYDLSCTDSISSQPPAKSFKTAPLPKEPVSFKFAFGSCFRPTTQDGGSIFNTIDKQRRADDLRFIMLLGDQIYADLWEYNGIGRVAITVEDYRDVYEYTWSRPPFRNLLTNLPAFMTLDDHEVDDDWAWDDTSRRWANLPIWDNLFRRLKRRPKDELFITIHRVRDALEAYWEHQGIHAPDCINPPSMDRSNRFLFHQDDSGSLAYSFNFGPATFFVMDTRTMRIRGNPRRMLDESQWAALENWLAESNEQYPVKFIASSSSIFFDMAIDIARDRWNGYKADRERLLKFIAQNGIKNLFVLAGDLHSAHAIKVNLKPLGTEAVELWEFCSTPFEQSTNSAARTYIRPRSAFVQNQKLMFSIPKQNYGVVTVDFHSDQTPFVNFSVHDAQGELLQTANIVLK